MHRFHYPIYLIPDDDGGFVVRFRDFPEAITQAESVEVAYLEAADCLDEAFAGRMRRNDEIPLPSPLREGDLLVAPPAETAAKTVLYLAMKESGVGKAELARRLACDEKEVRRLLDPHHASKLPRLARAVALLGKRLVIDMEPA